MSTMKIRAVLLLLAATILPIASPRAQSTAFTYQGALNNAGVPANGLYDFRFRLDADVQGNTILASVFTNGVPVNNGLFTVMLDYGSGFFNGSNYWLEIGVKTNNDLNYTTLNPLQSFTPTPYSLYAVTASNVTGIVNASQFNGTLNAGQLPANVVYSDSDGVSLSGSFAGDGSALTNFATGNFVFVRNRLTEALSLSNSNIVFQTNGLVSMIQGWSFTNDTADFYCPAAGRYLVQYTASATSTTPPGNFAATVAVNGSGIAGTATSGVAISTNYPSEISGFGIVRLAAGDYVSLAIFGTPGVSISSSAVGSCTASLMITPLPIKGQ